MRLEFLRGQSLFEYPGRHYLPKKAEIRTLWQKYGLKEGGLADEGPTSSFNQVLELALDLFGKNDRSSAQEAAQLVLNRSVDSDDRIGMLISAGATTPEDKVLTLLEIRRAEAVRDSLDHINSTFNPPPSGE